ncbi:MAG: nuclear transport factor 2 family protein, partial [Steroidobacteraceae bacterium]
MHTTRAVVLIALACACGAAAALALTRTNDVEQLIAVDKRQQAAYLTKDMAALDEIFTDDYVLVLSNGTERTKAEILKNAASPEARWEINETSGWKVRV